MSLESAQESAGTEETAPVGTNGPGRSRLVRAAPLMGLVLSAVVVLVGWQAGIFDSLTALREFIQQLGWFAPAVFMLLQVALVVFPVIPIGGVTVLAAPLLFGPVEGTIYNYVSICAGSLAAFALARRYGMALIQRFVPQRLVEKYLRFTRSPHFTRGFAVAILLPLAPDDILCYFAGTTAMRRRTFVAIILLAKPWAILAYSLGGSALVVHLLSMIGAA